MGAIMAIGIAASNSILLVHFANDRRMEESESEKVSPVDAAIHAGKTRFRPVLMTALAMVLGMAPMAIGLGEGGEQNAPLGRAVIGGLLVSTFATLVVIPCAYSVFRRKAPVEHERDRLIEEVPSTTTRTLARDAPQAPPEQRPHDRPRASAERPRRARRARRASS